MHVLLDESIPRGLRKLLPGHDVRTVVEEGWKSFRNSVLLSNAQERFEVFVTADRGFEHEQNLALFDIAVIILVAQSDRLADYEPLVPALRKANRWGQDRRSDENGRRTRWLEVTRKLGSSGASASAHLSHER